ncbi:ATP synthase subunit AtpR [Marivita sp. S2033]|uniref:ATP synthase subunit AtpR n=1 Tax=Marivita sp. S2033 TaxID=3373187 RepID=UPI0039826F01
MIVLDWTLVGLGAAAGAVAAALFFAGLAYGLRLALRSDHATPVLLLSAAVRIAALLGVGWLVAGQGPSALAGFVVAFLATRFGILVIARLPRSKEAAPCN